MIEVEGRDNLFQLILLREDDEESVEVEEVENVDFEEVKRRLENGKSVFVVHKQIEKLGKFNARLVAKQAIKKVSKKEARTPFFFTYA